MNVLVEKINPFSHSYIQQSKEYLKNIGMRGEFTVDIDSAILSEDALDVIFGTEKPIEEQEFSIQF